MKTLMALAFNDIECEILLAKLNKDLADTAKLPVNEPDRTMAEARRKIIRSLIADFTAQKEQNKEIRDGMAEHVKKDAEPGDKIKFDPDWRENK
jgi:hypothetical protein